METCEREICHCDEISEEKEFTREVLIVNERGLHARAAAMFVKEAGNFDAKICVEKGGQSVCGRSIMGLMMLAASKGCKINVTSSGNQAKEALEALIRLVSEGFYEAA